jgi:transposase, IS30 family
MEVFAMGRPAYPVELQRRFWVVVRTGVVLDDAAAAVGVSKTVALRWFRQAGGVIPASARGQRSPSSGVARLSFSEREEIALRRAAGDTVRAVALRLGRSPSTISRELRRGTVRRKSGYRASVAQARADARARRPKASKVAASPWLRAQVQDRLSRRHSPEQISRRLRAEFPDQPEMWVSHEAIYQALYVQGRGALRRELVRCLRTGRALRKPRRRTAERRGRIAGMVNISERPAEAEDRAVPGHWEGDLIAGPGHRSAIGTLVERSTGYVLLLHLPHGRGAGEVAHTMIETMSQLPQHLRRSLTWDQGRELTYHLHIAAAADIDIFFCDPHAPWQRGSNENTNGLLRQYFPKGVDLSTFGHEDLAAVSAELNERPRKRLSWRTPAEAVAEVLSNPAQPPPLR